MGLAVAEYSYQDTSIFTVRKKKKNRHFLQCTQLSGCVLSPKAGCSKDGSSVKGDVPGCLAMGRANSGRLFLCPLPLLDDVLWQDALGYTTWAFLQSDPD